MGLNPDVPEFFQAVFSELRKLIFNGDNLLYIYHLDIWTNHEEV